MSPNHPEWSEPEEEEEDWNGQKQEKEEKEENCKDSKQKEPEQMLKIDNKEEPCYPPSPHYTTSFHPNFYTDAFASALTNRLV